MAQRAQYMEFPSIFALVAAMGLLAPLPLHAEGARQNAGAEAPASTTQESLGAAAPEVKPGLAGSFLAGRFARDHQDLHEAATYLNETLAHDPDNLRLQHEAMRMNLLAGDAATAITLAKKLAARNETDPLVACLIMLESVKSGNYAAAKTTIEAAPQAGLFGLVRPVLSQWLAIGAGDVKGAVDMHVAIEKSGFFAPFLTYHSALMNDVLGNASGAATSYAKASADTGVTPYRVIEAYANFQARQNRWAEAQALFDQYAKTNPDSGLIPEKLQRTESVKPLVGNAREGLAELFFTTASILFGDDSSQDTFLYLRLALELRPNMPPAQLMLANLYEQTKDYKQAIATYDAIDDKSVFYRRGQIRKSLNLEAMGQREAALAMLEDLAKRYPADATALVTKGDMLREAENFDGAIEAYGSAITRTEPLTASDWPLLYARGISYERGGNWDQAEADFNRALILQPDQPDVLNYLSYSWLMMNKNIPQARENLNKALAARPNDAHIIDSVGWANYLAGDFKSAVEAFEKAVAMTPDDVTVNDHLGDAYWRVGREIEARYQWERALTFKPDTETATALRGKLEAGLPPFMQQNPNKTAVDGVRPPTATATATTPTATQVP